MASIMCGPFKLSVYLLVRGLEIDTAFLETNLAKILIFFTQYFF